MNNISNRFIITMAVTVLLMQAVRAQDMELPETPVGKIATLFFSAFNSDDEALMKDFTAQYRTEAALQRLPLEDRMAQHRQIKGMMQSLSPRHVTENTDQKLVVITYAKALDAWFETSFALSEADPSKLESFGLKPSTSPQPGEDTGFGEWENLTDLLNNVIDQHDIPAISMSVIKNGKISEAAVAGRQKIGSSQAVKVEDPFHTGSITKSMTATLIGWLKERGKLSTATTLRQVFPEIDMLPAYETVTIAQLLSHTSGLPGYLTATEEEEARLAALPGSPTAQRLAFTKEVLQESPTSQPGTAFAYSNAGYSILGAIAEKLSGKSWDQLLKEVIFKPLALNTAGVGWPADANDLYPVGHFSTENGLVPQKPGEYELSAHIEPAGDVYMSMADLAKYALAHINGVNGQGGILKAETFRWLHQTKEGQNYAGGWFVTQNEEGATVHEHAGSAGTFMALMMIEPASNQGWVIAGNAGSIALDALFRKVIATYKEK